MAYEDFTTYTKVDEGGEVTVDSATKVSWINLQTKYDTAYLYKDKGVGHFDGDFTHKFECLCSSVVGNWTMVMHWMLANSIREVQGLIDLNADFIDFGFYDPDPGDRVFRLYVYENGGLADFDIFNQGIVLSTLYFIEIVRDDDGGANNTGRLTAYIRTGSHSGTLKDTLVVDSSVGEQNDFRYIYALATYDTNILPGTKTNGYTQNLDLGGAPGWTGKINTITNPAKIITKAVADIAKVIGV